MPFSLERDKLFFFQHLLTTTFLMAQNCVDIYKILNYLTNASARCYFVLSELKTFREKKKLALDPTFNKKGILACVEQPRFLCVCVCVCVSFCLLFYIFVYILIFLVFFKSYWDHRKYIINKIESLIALSAMNMRYTKCGVKMSEYSVFVSRSRFVSKTLL